MSGRGPRGCSGAPAPPERSSSGHCCVSQHIERKARKTGVLGATSLAIVHSSGSSALTKPGTKRTLPSDVRHLLIAALLLPAAATAQAPTRANDSTSAAGATRARRLDPLIVTAARSARPISTAPAAVTALSRAELDALPVRTVAQALEFVPGIAVLQADGLGGAPQVIARGFYGGGETDYVLLLLDGVPLNGLTSGAANWDLVPLGSIETIEVMRGGASSLYGDAALGAVVNLITRRGAGAVRTLAATRGAFDVTRLDASYTDQADGRDFSLSLGAHRAGGYRVHETRDAVTFRAAATLANSAQHQLTLSALVHERRFDDPGPLDSAALALGRRGTLPFYRFDHTIESSVRLTADGSLRAGPQTSMHGYVAAQSDRANVIRTLPLSANYADTKRRIAPTARLIGSWTVETRGIGGIGRLIAATDASVGRLTSSYWELLNGNPGTYAASASGPPEILDAQGHGSRRALGAFANWEVEPAARLRLTAGARYDRLTDHFDPVLPADRPSLSATHTAWSPRIGANLTLLESERQELGAYMSVGRSFKAPTMDQLFDQRSIPVPFPPYSITTSNSLLVPQTGTGVEGGLQQRVELSNGRVSGRWSVTAYEMDMRHELDFDLAVFHFVNVAESRHRGIEAAVNLAGLDAMTAGFTYTLQSAVATNGANAGHNLRSIPRHATTVRVSHDPARGLSVSAVALHVQGAPFDDVNSSELPAYTRVDVRAAYGLGVARLVAEMRNALNASYSTTGFPDPAGSDIRFYYPAAGRVMSLGVEARW